MTKTTQNSSQGEVGTSTQPVDDRYLDALRRLRENLAQYAGPERAQQGFELLEALYLLTEKKARSGVALDHLGFEPTEIARQLSWSSLRNADATQVGAIINRAWKKAVKLFEGMEQGFRSSTQNEEAQFLVPRKLQSMGRNPSQYRWELQGAVGRPTIIAELPPGGLRYRPEWVDRYRVGILGLGVELSPLRLMLVFSGMVFMGIVAIGGIILAVAALRSAHWAAVIVFGLLGVMAVWAAQKLYSPVGDAKYWRVVAVPDYLQPILSVEPMQLVYDPEGDHIVRGVRHVGTCPVCNGRVTVQEGGRAFPDRLIGRCRASPREHVYSFDHLNLTGKPLQ